MENRFEGKVALVTGAARGIGKAVALRLAREGANVAAVDVLGDLLEETAGEIRALGREAVACVADLSSTAAMAPLLDRVEETLGGVDILVNVAGVLKTQPFLEVTEADWDRTITLNEKSLVFLIQAVAARMIERVPEEVRASGRPDGCYGKIVNFSSISGRHGRAHQVHYAASKAAVISITQSAALAFAQYGINVNAVAPGVVLTPMWIQNDLERSKIMGLPPGSALNDFIERTPLKRIGTPEDVAAVVAFLCSADADFMTGQTLNVDGGIEMN